MRILVVEDYAPVRAAILQALTEEGFTADSAGNGVDAKRLIGENSYDTVVLDIMLPEVNGLDVLTEMRASGDTTPVLMLTALDSINDRVKGLDEGADDYLVKPFAIPELLARVRALVRRGYGGGPALINIGPLQIDTSAQSVTIGDRAVSLTAREFALLQYLAMRVDQVVSREEICEHIYDEPQKTSNVVDVYVGYLRKKLEQNDAPRLLHTRRGAGYILSEREEGRG